MALKAEAIAVGRRPGGSGWIKGQLRNIAPFITLIFLVVMFGLASPSFLTVGNLTNVLRGISVTAIIATGLTFVILTAEIDLSVASVANAAAILVAYFTAQSPTSASPTSRSRAASRSCSPPSARWRWAAATPSA